MIYGKTEGAQLQIFIQTGDEELKIVWRTTPWFKIMEWVNGCLKGLLAFSGIGKQNETFNT